MVIYGISCCTMKTSLVLASIAASASAFAPAKQGATSSSHAATKADLEKIAEKANPIVKFYDPLNLAEADFYGMGTEATIGFLRHSEIKVRTNPCTIKRYKCGMQWRLTRPT